MASSLALKAGGRGRRQEATAGNLCRGHPEQKGWSVNKGEGSAGVEAYLRTNRLPNITQSPATKKRLLS